MIFGIFKVNFQGQDEVPEKIFLESLFLTRQTQSIETTLDQIPFHFFRHFFVSQSPDFVEILWIY